MDNDLRKLLLDVLICIGSIEDSLKRIILPLPRRGNT